MILLGADMHKGTHTIAAVVGPTGELLGDRTVKVGKAGFVALLDWARGLGPDRAWALEDCRHVSGSFERFLLVSGERVVRVPTHLMAGERRGGRERGKSDRIDATAVARVAFREGLDTLPTDELAGVELEIRLLTDHRERLVKMRTAMNNDLLWNLHDLWPELRLPVSSLRSKKWVTSIGRRLSRADQTARVRIARGELRHIVKLGQAIDSLEDQIAELVAQVAPEVLDEVGCGPLTVGKLIGKIAGAHRFSTDAKLARASGIAPIPVSSGKTDRYRLDLGGNRQLNAAIHRIAVVRARWDPESRAYVEHKREEGKSQREALRCLKRHLVRRIWRQLQPPPTPTLTTLSRSTS